MTIRNDSNYLFYARAKGMLALFYKINNEDINKYSARAVVEINKE